MPTTLTLRTSPSPFAVAPRPVARPSAPTRLAEANRLLLRGVETLERWDARFHQRRDLQALPDHLLHDIGRSRADVEAEATKPFWRARRTGAVQDGESRDPHPARQAPQPRLRRLAVVGAHARPALRAPRKLGLAGP